MFRVLPNSVWGYQHLLVLLMIAQSAIQLGDALTPIGGILSPLASDSQNENEENEREEFEFTEALLSPNCFVRQTQPRYVIPPIKRLPVDTPQFVDARLVLMHFDPAGAHIASGSGIFQCC